MSDSHDPTDTSRDSHANQPVTDEIEAVADRPDPADQGDVLQAGHDIGRASLAPLLQACSVPHTDLTLPDGSHHGQAASAISNSLGALQRATGRGMYRVFDDFIALVFETLRATPDQAHYQETIEPYAFTRDGDRRDDQPDTEFAAAFSTLLEATANGRLDVLGDVYHILGANHESFGQYFTPHNVTRMMVQLIGHPKVPDEFERGDTSTDALSARPIRGDTAGCGSGRLIVYQAQETPTAVFNGTDVDKTCAKMAAINCALLNVDARIRHGDALAQEIHNTYHVHYHPRAGGLLTVDNDPPDR